jgi:hypothetical protein
VQERIKLRTQVRRVFPLAVVLLCAVPQAAFAGQWYRCRYTGETRTTCCCQKQQHECDQARVSRADCCDLLHQDPSVVSARTEPRTDLQVWFRAVAVVSPAVVAEEPTPSGARVPFERATAPPLHVQPLYIRHSSFLL